MCRSLAPCARRVHPLAGAILLMWGALPLKAQTDFYNTDAGRPITTEDAYPTERYAFELQLAPLRLERSRGGVYNWGVEPEIAYGVLPRTHIELGAPFVYTDLGADRQVSGLAGVDLSLLHNLNVETTTFPAFGLVGEVLLPVGNLAPDRTYGSAKVIITRTYRWARIHLNGQYTFGSAPRVDDGSGAQLGAGAVELSRWLAAIALDRTFPLRSMLITGEVFVRQPIHDTEDVEWNAGGGIRYQLSPQFALDGGLGKRLTGEDQSWFATFGLAYAFGLPAFIRLPR
jgi:hypothetical protein